MKYKNINHYGDPGKLEWASRSWYGKETNIFHPWFLDELDLQKTLFGKIRRWLELEYNFHFTPTTSIPKCPTPISTIRWHIWYKFFYRCPIKELFKKGIR